MGTPQPLVDRIADKFLVGDGCWPWIAARNAAGYGRVNAGGRGRPLAAHRVVYELFVGPIPDGLQLDHLCRNRGCVRPDHLEPVTQAENMRRGNAGKVALIRAAAQTHCKYGHEFNDMNTRVVITASGGRHRICRPCKADRQRTRKWGGG